MRKACSLRCSTRLARSSWPSRALQKTQPVAGAFEAVIQTMRHGAHRRFTRRRRPSRVDELAEALADLEEGDALLRDIDGAAGLGVAALAGIAMANAEAAEAPQLDLVPLGERVGDVVEDRVDDRLRLLLRQVRYLRDFVDQLGFRHRRPTFGSSPVEWRPAPNRPLRSFGPERHASMPLERMSTIVRG